MARKISLVVNDMTIDLDYFVSGYIDHVVGGIIASLKDTGEIESLELTIDNQGVVTIRLNGADVPLTYFPVEIIKSTIEGMVSPLKGVEGAINKVELTITG